MESKKSKSELYLERLEKWRAEKQHKVAKKTGNVVTDKNAVTKRRPVSSVLPQPKILPKLPKPLAQKPNTLKRQSQVTVKKTVSANSAKVLKPVSNEDQELMSAKLKQWKSQREISKSSQKKLVPNSSTKTVTSTTKSHPASTTKLQSASTTKSQPGIVKQGKYVSVKSRLFDYKNKSAPTSRPTMDKENKVSVNKVKPGPHVKSALKRRHSEAATHEPPKKKPVGILKRKSCIGSFEMTGSRSVSHTENTEPETAEVDMKCETLDDVFTDRENVAMVNPCSESRNVRFVTPEHAPRVQGRELRKTPKTSQNRSEELNDWLKAKGRTPSKFRHLLCFHAKGGEAMANDPQTKTALTVEELSEQMDVIEREEQELKAHKKLEEMLQECMILFEAGCPAEAIVPWLDDIYFKIPIAQVSARFYISKAAVVKTTHDLDAVLKVFEEATINNAQPREELAKCLTETIKYVTEEKIRKAKRRSRTPRRSLVQEENMFESSSVVYTVTQATPMSEGKKSKSRADTPAPSQVITPVRRSTRRSLQNLPDSLKDKNEKYSSLSDLDEGSRDKFLFQPNLALDKLLAEVDEEEQKD